MGKKKRKKKFTEAIKKLNSSQNQAVTNTEGPVIAIAGPGTGKTHILTARIGQILMQTDAQAHNVLCLTFTDAAVNAMRERLIEFIGTDAHKVHIYTFHSFCNKVIQDNAELFGRHELESVSELERIQIIRELIDKLDRDSPLRQNSYDLYFYERHLMDLFQRMKMEKWTESLLIEKISQYIEELPDREDMRYKRNSGKYKKGDLKEGAIAEKTKRISLLTHSIPLFAEYNQALRDRQYYDFEDMILWVIKAFEEEENLLRLYQEQYLYLLVDEFQDTNGSQSKIVEQLASYWGDNPNLFIVGDDDQSIYEFQGARIRNMTDLYDKYKKNLLLVLLEENYRSTQNILDLSGKLIKNNTIRIINKIEGLETEKVMIGRNQKYSGLNIPVKIIAYPNQVQEELAIIQRIEQLVSEGVLLKDIAIIFAKHKQARNLINLMEKRGISYQTKRRTNILELPLIHNLRKLMSYISGEYESAYSNESIFFEFLHYNFLGFTASDVSKLSAWMSKRRTHLLRNNEYEELPKWRDIIRDYALLEGIGLDEIDKFINFSKFLDESIHKYSSLSLPKFFEWIINKSGLILFAAKNENNVWLIQVLNTLFNFIVEESDRNERIRLKELLKMLDLMESNRISLGLFQIHSSENGVNLVTAHSAKGLEFEYVFIINANEDMWGSSRQNRGKFHYPETLTFSNDSDEGEAKRRLFYVAMTRAKKALEISYFKKNIKNKVKPRSTFVDELLYGEEENLIFIDRQAELTDEWQMLLLAEADGEIRLPIKDRSTINFLLEGFKLSISAMNSYIYCPLSFYFEHVLRLPRTSSDEAAYGTAVHNTLNRVFSNAARTDKQLPENEVVIDCFISEMGKQRINLTKESYNEQIIKGKIMMENYYSIRKKQWQDNLNKYEILTEKVIHNSAFEGIPLTGTIDKIEIKSGRDGKSIHLVDYKTGKPNKKHLVVAKKAGSTGGSYWRQLIFYKILFENSGVNPYKVVTAEIDYFSKDDAGNYVQKVIEITKKEVERVEEMIKKSYRSIMNHEFEDGCGRDSCKWCNFSRRNLVPKSFVNVESESLDD